MSDPRRISIVVPGEPVPKARPRVTAQGTYTSQRTRDAEKLIGRLLLNEWHADPDTDHHFSVRVRFASGRRKLDGDNILKLVLDAANGVVYRDDSQVWLGIFERVLAVGDGPGTMIEIWQQA